MVLRFDRLFHTLVVLGAASCAADDSTSRRETQVDAANDAGPGDLDALPAGDGGVTDLDPCFCDVSACCDRTSEPALLAPGFECCWSTTCP